MGKGQPKCLSDQQFIRRHKKEEKVTTFLSQVTREQNPSQSLTEKWMPLSRKLSQWALANGFYAQENFIGEAGNQVLCFYFSNPNKSRFARRHRL